MSRKPLPGADELFRATSPPAVPREVSNEQGVLDGLEGLSALPPVPEPTHTVAARPTTRRPVRRAKKRDVVRAPSGRERHEEKITVYVSRSELLDLERARLVLRGEHGVVVDRGRIVREALASVLGDLEEHGEASVLVRRLSGP